MKKISVVILLLSIFFGSAFVIADFPQAEISNGVIKAKLLLPDSQTGYYQGTRFDWSGVIESLEYKGHSYFGQWFKKYDPKMHDATMGPVESFGPVGYDEADVNATFLKVGVGMLRKPDDKPYVEYKYYEIANAGKWKIKSKKDQVEFSQQLTDETGYAYQYTKTVSLVKGKPELVLSHQLKNTGKKLIETNIYDHNFFMIDREPTGPAIKIKFPFAITPGNARGLDTLATIRGNEINYLQELPAGKQLYIGTITGFGKEAKDYDFSVENKKTGAGVRITCDQPLEKMVYWSSATTYCPEPYIHVKIEPGKEFKWTIRYEFYEFPKE